MKTYQVKNEVTGKISLMTEENFNNISENPLSKDKGKSILKKLKEVDEFGFEINSKESKDFKKKLSDEQKEKDKLK